VINTAAGVSLNASLSPLMPPRGRVGFFCQSGALGVAILETVDRRGLGLSTFVSAGNRADVSGNDLLQYWEEDAATEVVLLYLESIGNPRKFSRIARRVGRRKPIVAVKSGRTTQGIPVGHAVRRTSAPQAAVDAMFRQAGVIQVDTLDEMLDVAQLLAHQPLPRGPRVAVVGNSDALGLLAADAGTAAGLSVREPVALGADATAADFERALDDAIDNPEVDAVVAVYIPPLNTSGEEVANVLAAVGEQSDKPIVSTFLARHGVPELLRVADVEGEAGRGSVPSYPAPEMAVRALARGVSYATWLARTPGRIRAYDNLRRDAARRLVAPLAEAHPDGVDLTREQIVELLDAYGISTSEPETGEPAEGAVELLIESFEDPLFGPVLSFGVHGPPSELLGDRAYRIPPLTDADAEEMVRDIGAAPLLFGYGGAQVVDIEAIEDVLQRLANLKNDLPEVARLELRPAVATSDGVRVVGVTGRVAPAVDARTDSLVRRMGQPVGLGDTPAG
jgi:acyl-CoA synthetase (NDP forming)